MKRAFSYAGLMAGVVFAVHATGAEEAAISFGGQIRQRYEYFNNPLWGAGAEDADGHWLQRYMLHVDLRLNESVRAFAELKSGLVNDRVGGPRPTDEDELDLHQAFADARWSPTCADAKRPMVSLVAQTPSSTSPTTATQAKPTPIPCS